MITPAFLAALQPAASGGGGGPQGFAVSGMSYLNGNYCPSGVTRNGRPEYARADGLRKLVYDTEGGSGQPGWLLGGNSVGPSDYEAYVLTAAMTPPLTGWSSGVSLASISC